MSNWAKTNTN